MTSTWMGDLLDTIGPKAVNTILLPATHDSGSYSLATAVPIQHTTCIFNLVDLQCECMADLIRNWAITQTLSIAGQLAAGIRKFDLRVTYSGGQYYVTHSFVMELLSVVIADVQAFTMAHPAELIFVNISVDDEPVQNWTATVDQAMWNLWITALGTRIWPYSGGTFPLYQDAVKIGRTVFLFGANISNNNQVWTSGVQALWVNTPDPADEIAGLTAWIPTVATKDPRQLYGVSFAVTPDTPTVFGGFFNGTGLSSMTLALQNMFTTFWSANVTKLAGFSFFQMDFPTASMINTIINFNKIIT